jgi:hypothetical protein
MSVLTPGQVVSDAAGETYAKGLVHGVLVVAAVGLMLRVRALAVAGRSSLRSLQLWSQAAC